MPFWKNLATIRCKKLKEIYSALADFIKSHGREDPTGLFLEMDLLKIEYQKISAFVRLFYLIPRIHHNESLKGMVWAVVGKLEEKKFQTVPNVLRSVKDKPENKKISR